MRGGTLAEVEVLDMRFLTKVGKMDSAGAYEVVAAGGDKTHVCGLAPIYGDDGIGGRGEGEIVEV